MVKKFPRRPRVIVEFFLPRGGQPRPEESLQELADRLVAEIRGKVPPAGG
jgi:1-acyl-sn-glycerol-3-phosphate acyltransferase